MHVQCPKDPEHKAFLTTIQETREVLANDTGEIVEVRGLADGGDTDIANAWHCSACGAEAIATEKVMSLRGARLEQLIDEHRDDSGNDLYGFDLDNPAERYLLIERDRRGGRRWLTLFDSPDDAAEYNDNQECADEWDIESLVDLDSGDEIAATTTTTFG